MNNIPKLNIDFKSIFNDWCHYLNILLVSKYMHNLMVFLNEAYKSRNIYPTNKLNVFKPFQLVSFNKVRVVIIGREPYNDKINTGIPFAQQDGFALNLQNSFHHIEENIKSSIYDSFKLSMDTELEHWTRQGVLPLYSALTVEKNKTGSHLMHWRNFTREVIKALNNNRTGIIYCLWGEEAQYFKKFINDNSNFILECDNPQYIEKSNKWDCNHFTEINKIITENNGSDFNIKW